MRVFSLFTHASLGNFQVRASYFISPFYITESGVTGKTEQPAHAFTAGPALAGTALVVVINEDCLAVSEDLPAHGARVPLVFQDPIELALREPVPRKTLRTAP